MKGEPLNGPAASIITLERAFPVTAPVRAEKFPYADERPGVLDHRTNTVIDGFCRHGLGQELGHAGIPGRANVMKFRVGGTYDDRDIGVGTLLVHAEAVQELHPIQVYGPVTQNKVNRKLQENVPSYFRVVGCVM